MKKFISIAVALCMVLSLAMVPVSAETTVLTDNFELENQGTITNGSSSGGHYASSNGLLIKAADAYGPYFSFVENGGYNSSIGLSVPYGILQESFGVRGGMLQTKALTVGAAAYKLSYKVYFDKIATTPANTSLSSDVYQGLGAFGSGISDNTNPFWVSTGGKVTVSSNSKIKSPAYTLSEGKWYTIEVMVGLDGSTHSVLKDDTGAVATECLLDRSLSPLSGSYSIFLVSHTQKKTTDEANTIFDDVSLTTYDLAEAPVYDATNSTVAEGSENVSISDAIHVAFDQPIENPEDVVIYEKGDASKTPIIATVENHKLNSFDIVPGAAQLGALTDYVIDCTALTNGTTASKDVITFTTENRAPSAIVLSDDFDTAGQVGTVNNHWSGDRYSSANGLLAATPVAPASGDGSFSLKTMTIANDGTGTNNVLRLSYELGASSLNRGASVLTKAVDLSAGSYKLSYDIMFDDLPNQATGSGSYMALGLWSRSYTFSTPDSPFYVKGGETPSIIPTGSNKTYALEEDTWYKLEMYYTAEGIIALFLDADGDVICSSKVERKAEDGVTYNLYVVQHIRGATSDSAVTMVDNVSLTTYSQKVPPTLIEKASLADGAVISTSSSIELTFDQTIANPEDIVIYADGDENATVTFAVEEAAGLKYTITPIDMAAGDYVIDLSALSNGVAALVGTQTLTFSAEEAEFGITSAVITEEGKLEIESESDIDGIKMSIVVVGYTTTDSGAKTLTGTHIIKEFVAGESISTSINEVISNADEVKAFVFYSTKSLRPMFAPIDVEVQQAEEAPVA